MNHINTLTTVYMTNTFNTGNRMLDNSLVAIAAILIGNIITYLTANWRKLYNACIYSLYCMDKHPFAISKAPYLYQTKLDITQSEFKQEYTGYLLDHIRNGRVSTCGQYLKEIMCTNNLARMSGKNGEVIYCGDQSDKSMTSVWQGIYLIHIMRSGELIYYSTTDHSFYGANWDILRSVLQSFERYIEGKIKDEQTTPKPTNLIQSPMFDKDGRITLTSAGTLTSVGTISAKKTFDSLFYEEKATLIHLLEKFKAGTMYPAHVPMDNKLGILLYGPPGTGKTGTISAIANMLQRNIVLVNFTQITKGKELDVVFEKAVAKESVFVFDEFDCILDALGKGGDHAAPKNDWGGMLLAAEGEERKEILSMMRNGIARTADAPIDLAYLLQKLDGLVSAEGRVIIATTNNPDKINPALLRPGRFDLKLCLGNCTRAMVADILEYYYKDSGEGVREAVMKSSIADGFLSPLTLMNRAMQAPDFETLLKSLK